MNLALIDTHTHFDMPAFDYDREQQAALAYQKGVRHIVLIGFLAKYFEQMVACQTQMSHFGISPQSHLAFGLHPVYILEQNQHDLETLERFIKTYAPIAIGEIGLDTYPDALKIPKNFAKQQDFFCQQIEMAASYKRPILLHIRKSHAETLKMLRTQKFIQGGIAHSFSGGIQEARAFVELGFKIGVTGQITNPNAKKLRNTIVELVKHVGIESLVVETDCPDMTPLECHHTHGRRNVPANLPWVVDTLCDLTDKKKDILIKQLWDNSCSALNVDWQYE